MAFRIKMKGGENDIISYDDLILLIKKRAKSKCGTYGYFTQYKCSEQDIDMDKKITTTVGNMITKYEYNDVENEIDLLQFQNIESLLKTISYNNGVYTNLIKQLSEYNFKKWKHDTLYIKKTNEFLRNLDECKSNNRCIYGTKQYNVTVKTINALLQRHDLSYLKAEIGEAVNAELVEPTFMPATNPVNVANPVNDANPMANPDTSVVDPIAPANPDTPTNPKDIVDDFIKFYKNLSREKQKYVKEQISTSETAADAETAAGGSRRRQSRRKQSKRRKGKQSKRRIRKHSKKRK
jgi:hypothetical protein